MDENASKKEIGRSDPIYRSETIQPDTSKYWKSLKIRKAFPYKKSQKYTKSNKIHPNSPRSMLESTNFDNASSNLFGSSLNSKLDGMFKSIDNP